MAKLQRYQEIDLPRLVELFNSTYQGRHEFAPYTETRLQKEPQEVAAIILAVDECDKVEGAALLHRTWYGEEIEVCARSGSKQSKVEAQVLTAIEREVRSDPVTVVVTAQDQRRIETLLTQGYEADGGLYQLVTKLEEPQSLPPAPGGYLLRTLKTDDEAALISIVNTAYQSENRLRPGVLDKWKSEDTSFDEAWVQVAEYRGQLVAAVVARSDKEFNEHYRARRGYLGPAATLVDHAGKGLGRILTAQAMNLLFTQRMRSVSLYTLEENAAALGVTKSLDFQISYHRKFLNKILRRDSQQ